MSYTPQLVDVSFPVSDLSNVFISGVSVGNLTAVKLFDINGNQVFPNGADQGNIAITTTPQSIKTLLGSNWTNALVGFVCTPSVELNITYNYVNGVTASKQVPANLLCMEGRIPAFYAQPNMVIGDINGIATLPISQTLQMALTGAQGANTALIIGAASTIFNPGGSNPINQAFIDMQGWAGGTIQIQTLQAGVTSLSVRGSNDGVNWTALAVGLSVSTGGTTVTTAPATGYYTLPNGWRFLQIIIAQAGTSGTTSAYVHLTSTPATLVASILGTSTAAIGGLNATTSGGATTYRNINVGATGALIKGASGNLFHIVASNDTATKCYLKLYDKVTAPTVGTDTPFMTILVPAGGVVVVPFSAIASKFSAGLGIGATGLIADSDTTAPGTNACAVVIEYI